MFAVFSHQTKINWRKKNSNFFLPVFWPFARETNSIETINLGCTTDLESTTSLFYWQLDTSNSLTHWKWGEKKYTHTHGRCNIFHMNLINLGCKFVVSSNHGHFRSFYLPSVRSRRCVIAYNFYRSATIIYHIFISIFDLVFVGYFSFASFQSQSKNLNPRNPVSFKSI